MLVLRLLSVMITTLAAMPSSRIRIITMPLGVVLVVKSGTPPGTAEPIAPRTEPVGLPFEPVPLPVPEPLSVPFDPSLGVMTVP